jgi:CBS domain-containing protein
MRPLDQLQTVNIGTPVSEAMELIGRSDINQLPVMSADGKLAGVISRDHILRLLTTRAELNK